MIPEYKLYHGAVLAELVDIATEDVFVGELREEGRLSAYTLNREIGLYIKYSTKRLTPWQFTVARSHVEEWAELQRRCKEVFLALVCHRDGIVALPIREVVEMLSATVSDQAWLRVDRRRGRWYTVNGNGDAPSRKRARGLGDLLESVARY